jgi:hypothetical protein
MSGEWGPWIEHDGKGCPCIGKYVHVFRKNGREVFSIAGEQCLAENIDPNGENSAWVWISNAPRWDEIVRYRIRKPRALIELRDMIADLPAPAERVDA